MRDDGDSEVEFVSLRALMKVAIEAGLSFDDPILYTTPRGHNFITKVGTARLCSKDNEGDPNGGTKILNVESAVGTDL